MVEKQISKTVSPFREEVLRERSLSTILGEHYLSKEITPSKTEQPDSSKKHILYVGQDRYELINNLTRKGYAVSHTTEPNEALSASTPDYILVGSVLPYDAPRLLMLKNKHAKIPIMILPDSNNLGNVIPSCHVHQGVFEPENIATILQSPEFLTSTQAKQSPNSNHLEYLSGIVQNAYASLKEKLASQIQQLIPQLPIHANMHSAYTRYAPIGGHKRH